MFQQTQADFQFCFLQDILLAFSNVKIHFIFKTELGDTANVDSLNSDLSLLVLL